MHTWLKETGTLHWLEPNTGATDEWAFTALSGGLAFARGFSNLGMDGNWWSSSAIDLYNINSLRLSYLSSNAFLTNMDIHRFISVRCVKD